MAAQEAVLGHQIYERLAKAALDELAFQLYGKPQEADWDVLVTTIYPIRHFPHHEEHAVGSLRARWQDMQLSASFRIWSRGHRGGKARIFLQRLDSLLYAQRYEVAQVIFRHFGVQITSRRTLTLL